MICGNTLLGDASWQAAASSRRPGTNSSDEMRSSGPLFAPCTAIASTTTSPAPPSAKRTYRSRTSALTRPSSPDRRVTIAGTTTRFGSVTPAASVSGSSTGDDDVTPAPGPRR